ncbi:MAG: T9SS type A sorting domain-containing protein [Cyclobacteriaceae bacterium]|nr:T9SS type A sorting domain-containing protein [Cyclobacteriaceae bacterium]
MRSKLTCFLLLLLPFLGHAQGQQVTNLAGFDISVSNFIVTSSIGETAIMTFANSNIILTQGFLQPEILPCKDVSFSYYPNPAKEEITMEAYGCEVQVQFMELFDSWGRIITVIKPNKDKKVHLGDISPGVYFIKIQLTNNESKTIKVIKVGT